MWEERRGGSSQTSPHVTTPCPPSHYVQLCRRRLPGHSLRPLFQGVPDVFDVEAALCVVVVERGCRCFFSIPFLRLARRTVPIACCQLRCCCRAVASVSRSRPVAQSLSSLVDAIRQRFPVALWRLRVWYPSAASSCELYLFSLQVSSRTTRKCTFVRHATAQLVGRASSPVKYTPQQTFGMVLLLAVVAAVGRTEPRVD